MVFEAREPAIEVAVPTVTPSVLVIVAHGGRANGLDRAHRGRLTYLRMLPFARLWPDTETEVWRLRYRYRGWNGQAAHPLRDVEWAVGQANQRHPGVPVVLVGHSMGGRAALLADGDGELTAVCALAPWLEPADPITQLNGRRVLIAHGDRDLVTDPAQSLAFARRSAGAGNPVHLETVTGDGHAMMRRAGHWHRLVAGFVDSVAGRGDA